MKALKIVSVVLLLGSILVVSSEVFAQDRSTGRGTGPVIYVTSHGLWYDSIVLKDPLPQKGRFQELVPTMMGLTTEWGPGDYGHVGGRWWVDLDENGVMDATDHYFLCPLLGPGRSEM